MYGAVHDGATVADMRLPQCTLAGSIYHAPIRRFRPQVECVAVYEAQESLDCHFVAQVLAVTS